MESALSKTSQLELSSAFHHHLSIAASARSPYASIRSPAVSRPSSEKQSSKDCRSLPASKDPLELTISGHKHQQAAAGREAFLEGQAKADLAAFCNCRLLSLIEGMCAQAMNSPFAICSCYLGVLQLPVPYQPFACDGIESGSAMILSAAGYAKVLPLLLS